MTDTPPATGKKWWRNHLLWFAPLLTFSAGISYFTVFARYPVLRDFPWLNLPLVLVGFLLSVLAFVRTFSRRSRINRKLIAATGLLFSFAIASLFCAYIFYLSYQLPAPAETTLSIETAPGITLIDHTGREVSLSQYQGRKLILTFYRGHW